MTKHQKLAARFENPVGRRVQDLLRSRAAYKGVSTRRQHRIEILTGRLTRVRRATGPIHLRPEVATNVLDTAAADA